MYRLLHGWRVRTIFMNDLLCFTTSACIIKIVQTSQLYSNLFIPYIWCTTRIDSGPLIILLYINDSTDCLDKESPCLYAADTQIFSAATDLKELNENLNHDMEEI